MFFKKITLLDEKEYAKYKSKIPETSWWWLKTSCNDKYRNCVRVVNSNGDLCGSYCFHNNGGVRPVGVFNIEPGEPMFWCKSERLIGSKIKFGKFEWIILNIENGELHTLCSEIIAEHRFDENTDKWDESELKRWLDTEGVKMITV